MKSMLNEELMILEIKFNHFIPAGVLELLQAPSTVHTAASKYCIGRMDKCIDVVY